MKIYTKYELKANEILMKNKTVEELAAVNLNALESKKQNEKQT